MKKKTELVSRGLIIQEGKILVCRDKMNKNYFLPGGHVEFREFSSDALSRELKEELFLEAKEMSFIGVAENMYSVRGSSYHEINFVYRVEHNGLGFSSKEEHIEFSFFTAEEFKESDVRPVELKKAVLCWLKEGQFFHVKTIDQ